jgi:uncharacterized protein YhjY with autotransporter beta-barrel domain
LSRALKGFFASLLLVFAAPALGQVIACPNISVTVIQGGLVTIEQPGAPIQSCSPQSSPSECETACSPQSPSDVFTFTAIPDTNWLFVQWTSSTNSPENTAVITRGPWPGQTYVDLENLQAIFEPDTDGDGVGDATDQCPNTPVGAQVDSVGCAQGQLDDDNDGVANAADQCPNTPAGESVDADGCASSQIDADGDGISNDLDQCPNTPPGTTVDASGCADSQLDDDGDNVTNDIDNCPNTPAGEVVNGSGCAESQLDDDTDGVTNDKDACPATPQNDDPDETGCGASQRDTDSDGVNDSTDLCPNTPSDESVDADGCADTQKDTDSDGVNDALDQCPDTPFAEEVDDNGCSEGQRDDDGDGIVNAFDACDATPSSTVVNEEGCSKVQEALAQFGEDLVELVGLDDTEQDLAGAIDDACPRLIIASEERSLTPGQEALKVACANLKSANSTPEQQRAALAAISPELLTNRADAVVETASRQFKQVTQRLSRIKSGGGRGFSVAGLTLNFAGEAVSGSALEQVADEAGVGDLGPDFGNWGVYIQGDIDITERRDTDQRRQYDEDSWLMTLGADYRFSPDLYAGAALSYGETETDYLFADSDTETTAVTLYGGWQFSEGGFLDAQLGYASDDYNTSRRVEYLDAGGAFSANYLGGTSGSHLTAAFNLGYMFSHSGWRIGPTASYFYLDGDVDGFQERAEQGNSEAWELVIADSDFRKTILRLGLQIDYAWLTDFGVVMPGLIVNYVSESNKGDTTTGSLLANDLQGQGQSIAVDREFLDGDYWDASFNLAGQFSYGFSGFASYRITASRSGYTHRGYTLGLRWDQAF